MALWRAKSALMSEGQISTEGEGCFRLCRRRQLISQVRDRGGSERTGICPIASSLETEPLSNEIFSEATPRKTPLFEVHRELAGKIVDFAGWSLPIQYDGIIAEHRFCREHAGLFDVSHMGQVLLHGGDAAATAFERLVPGNIQGLGLGQARYTVFTNDQGGVLDDLIVSRIDQGLFVVVNAGCRDADIAHMRQHLGSVCDVEELADQALLAVQGPSAAAVLAEHAPEIADLRFMETKETRVNGLPCRVSRLGYTGEDGFEISVDANSAADLAKTMLAHDEVRPIGLGARDSLRMEAGLCLYGHELSPETTPVEAGLGFAIGKRRREEGGFPGADVIQQQLEDGPERRLVGLRPIGRAPAREQTEIQDQNGETIGQVTSGGFGPSVNAPISIGYVVAAHAAAGTLVKLVIRGKHHDAEVATLPFLPHRYHR